jgi:putative CocE/NonD family hydrolase
MKALICHKIPMSDGVRLAADIFLPDSPGPFPVLLSRTPYNRRGRPELILHLLEDGYAFVSSDVRGKHDSEGDFRPVHCETRDGQDTIAWIAEQPWCNGRIGLSGLSYGGMVQVPAAAGGHPALRCITPGVAPANYFTDWLRHDGCFALANAVRWALMHASSHVTAPIDHFDLKDLYRLGSLDEVFQATGIRSPALAEWVEHDSFDDYWAAVDHEPMYPHVRAAGLHTGGWFDHLTRGQFQDYAGLRARAATPEARAAQRLFIGPWGHANLGKTGAEHIHYGEWYFGPDADVEVRAYIRRFLDLHLRDIDDGLAAEPPVRVFLMGENRWLSLPDWPPADTETRLWHLGDGTLSPDEPAASGARTWTHDPADPVPTRGGAIYWDFEHIGPADQRPLLDRPDVLLYQSRPLERSLAVVGEPRLELTIAGAAPDADFIVRLCVVEPGGRVVSLTNGSLRCRFRESWTHPAPLQPGEPTPVTIRFHPTAGVFPERSRIALVIAGSDFPRILPNPNTFAPTWQEPNPRPADQTILHGPQNPSTLHLPVLPL